MKILRAAATLAFLLACAPAFAQWQTPNHSVPLGRGIGVTGFGSVAPGTAGQPLVSQGSTSDPAFGTIANSGLTPGPANTVKGSLDGTTVSDEALPACTAVNQSLRWTAGVGFSCGVVSVTTGYDMPINLGLSVPAPSGNALVITLTQADGTPPTSSQPVLAPFRSTALATGTVTWATIPATQSITIPSGATLGTSNGVPFRIWIFEDYNGGTPELGVATCSNATTLFPCASWESTLRTSTTINASANAAGTLYATAGVTADAVRIIGFCEFSSGLMTAGAWTSACTTLQVFGPGVQKPGDVVQTVTAATTTSLQITNSATKTALTLSGSITPTSTANLIRVIASGNGTATSVSTTISLFRTSGATQIGSNSIASGSSPVYVQALDLPPIAAGPAVQYGLYSVNSASSGNYFWLGTITGGTPSAFMEMQEVKG